MILTVIKVAMGLEKRRGKIELIEGWIQSASLDMLVSLFGDFYPLWIDSGGKDADGKSYLIYHGLSEHFEEIEDGDDVPLYSASIILGDVCNYIQFDKVDESR